MPMTKPYTSAVPSRAQVDALAGPTLLEFGANWCGYCIAAQPLVAAALAEQPQLRHIKVEDGSGRPLGRSFGVKLWPTLIFLNEGQEVARVIRPSSVETITQALSRVQV